MSETPYRLLSPAEAAEIAGCSRQHIYNLISRGELPSVKLGRIRRIRPEDLDRLSDAATPVSQ